MSKIAPDATIDAMLAKIATATRQVVCSAAPANYAGIAAVALADVTMTAGSGNGDYLIANGDTSGRKVGVLQQTNVPIDASGDATHIALDDGSALIYVTECASQALTAGGTVTIPEWDVEIADPT